MCVFSRSEFLIHSFHNVQRDFLHLKTLFIAYHQVRSSPCMVWYKIWRLLLCDWESLCVYCRWCLWSCFWVIQQFSHFICSFLFQFPVLSMSPAWDGVTIILWSCTSILYIFWCEQILLLSGIFGATQFRMLNRQFFIIKNDTRFKTYRIAVNARVFEILKKRDCKHFEQYSVTTTEKIEPKVYVWYSGVSVTITKYCRQL